MNVGKIFTMGSLKEVEITTFINPHLFWYIINNEERTKSLKNLDKILQEISKNPHSKSSTKFPTFEIGEIVAVSLKNKLFRATIEYICEPNYSTSYLCWLIDHGTMIECNDIHKVSPSVRRTPPLAFQACLNNVVYLEQHLRFDNIGEATITSASVKTPTTKSYQVSSKILSKASSIHFNVEDEDEGIVFGDIVYKDEENNEKSLRSTLIEMDVLKIDENVFEEIKDSLDDYKERNVMLIAQICTNNKHLETLLADASFDPVEACTRLKLKYCHEFEEDNKLLMSEDEFSGISSKTRSKANGSGTSVDSDSPKTLDDCLSRRKQLLQKFISERRSLNKSDQDSLLSDSVDAKETESVDVATMRNESKTAETPKSKIKRLLEAIKTEKEKKLETETDNTTSKRKIVFYPAGGERTCFQRSVKRNKQVHKGYPVQSVSSDDVSLNTINHETPVTPKSESFQPKITSSASKCSTTDDTDFLSDGNFQSEPQAELSERHTDMETEGDDTMSTESSLGNTSTTNNDRVSTLKIKPHCSCKQCEHWTKEENVWEDGPSILKKVSKIVPISRQLLFKEGKGDDGDTNIISLDFDSMTKIEKRAVPKLLVHSGSIPTPVRILSKLPFHREVHRSLEQLDYKVAKLIQAYAWPALFRNQNLCMVHGPKTGKTLAYLPVMCTFVLEKVDRYESLLNVGGGPIVIILCADSKKCEDVYDLAKVLTRRNWTKIQLITYPIGHINSNHVDIVITTPPILLEMLKTKTLNFKRLCHLILEDGDEILNRHHEETRKFFDLAQSMLSNRVFSKSVQLIVCSEHWNKKLSTLLRSLEQVPMVCIGNYLEAALYGKMEFSMKFSNSACKESELRVLLKDTYRIHKSVIVCNESEIEDVETILRLKGIDSTVVSDSMSLEEVSLREDMWALAKGGCYTVLVCTDFLLNTMLTVTKANKLIHYSLPSSWTKFVQRFRCLLENCKSPLDNNEVKIVSQSIVLIDETSESQMHKFFSYIYSTELKNQLPEKLQRYAESLVNIEEEEKHELALPLCDKLKLFGKCQDCRCRKRHTPRPTLDLLEHLPKSGTIKFKITFLQDVTLFSIKLLQHIDNHNKIDEFDEMTNCSEDLTCCLRISKKKLRNPVEGHIYAYYDCEEKGSYHRAELLRVVDDTTVKVKLIDKGTVLETLGARLYRLPSEFKESNKPRAVIDAYLANYIPPFQDQFFCARSFHHLQSMLDKMDYQNVIFTGDVHLQLGNTLWLKNVCQQVELSDMVVPGCQISREVARKSLVTYSNDQLYNLYKLCADAGIALPSYDKKPTRGSKSRGEKVVWQWAHLDVEGVNEVTFSAAVSPDEVYVRLNKFGDLLYAFQKEIQQSLAKPNYPKLQSVTVGNIYLAKDPDDLEYCRVLVLKIEEDKALCFYVDFGDEIVIDKNDLRPILDAHVTRLPFQSVQCRLEGVAPIGTDWGEHVRDTLYEYAVEPQTDIFRTLYLRVCQKEPASFSGQKRYSVLMKDGFGDRNALINMLLIECGWAVQNSDGIQDFEIPSSIPNSEDSNDEIVEAIDICKKTDELEENFVADQHFYNPDELELFLDDDEDPTDFFKAMLNFNNKEQSTMQNRELPSITAAPAGDFYTPEIYWSQTESTIRISIRLTDVEDYKLTLTKGRILNFRTDKDEKTYSLKLMFYDTVQSMQHTSPGPDIRVTLVKTKPIDWPRLILAKQRARNIHYDLANMAVADDEPKRFLQLPKELQDVDSDGDDGEGPMYHVTSDLDSDFDVDLPHDSD